MLCHVVLETVFGFALLSVLGLEIKNLLVFRVDLAG